ncbi:hypothetical protein J2X97_000353 [Epilithonimonas hungarica]|uniref:hypothetical protein n=1 Tax=Epilithonimonas hungarica TaxID=454006 RepID=UPI0027864841|nr:hypothetical protein [Epilithonimonas hungarica]MDP9954716.1 hypothetical protein [Epilithonimonas hungarica]
MSRLEEIIKTVTANEMREITVERAKQIAIEYAREVAQASLEKASEKYKLHIVDVDRYGDETVIQIHDSQGYPVQDDSTDNELYYLTVDKESITNPDNITLL